MNEYEYKGDLYTVTKRPVYGRKIKPEKRLREKISNLFWLVLIGWTIYTCIAP